MKPEAVFGFQFPVIQCSEKKRKAESEDSPEGTQAAWDAARESNQVLPRRVRSRGTARIN